MSKAVCCDRCGKFAKLPLDDKPWKVLDNGTPSVSDPIGERVETLLCPDCYYEFNHFMHCTISHVVG